MSVRAQRGSLRKRKSGGVWTWLGSWWENGSRRAKTLGKCAAMTKADAQEELGRIVRPLNEQLGAVEYTLQGFARQVVFPWYERSWKPSTAMTTKDRIDHHIMKELGITRLSNITRNLLQDFLDRKAASGLSHSTVAHLRWDLRQLLRMAVNDGLLPRNPADLLHIPKGKRNARTILSIEQVRTLLGVLPLRDSLILKLAAIVGMRPGEILALQWTDLQPDGLHITRGIYRGIIQTPKTHHSVRTAAISDTIRTDFATWRMVSRHTDPADWIFPNERGNKPLAHGNYWRNNIKKTLDNLGMIGVTFQALRRTAVTLLNETSGADATIIAAQCGHTVDVSLNVYNKVGISRQAAAVQQVSAAISGPVGHVI